MRSGGAARALAASGLLLFGASLATAQVSPRQLSDCTFLTNPTELRQCIERAEAGRLYRGPGRPEDEPRTAVPAPRIDAERPTAAPGAAPEKRATPSKPGSSVWVEQVGPNAASKTRRKAPARQPQQ